MTKNNGGDEQRRLKGAEGSEIEWELRTEQETEGSGEVGSKPRVKKPNRDQMVMAIVDVEELVAADHPARAIWALVGGLDLSAYEQQIKSVEGKAGRPMWDPQLLISLWLYAYSDGVNSAREIERLCGHDPAYRWLAGMEKVNHHSLSDFRMERKEELDGLFAQLLGVLRADDLISLDRVTQDGTKIKAFASSKSFKREDKIRKCIHLAEEYIDEIDRIGEEEMNRRRKRRGCERRVNEKRIWRKPWSSWRKCVRQKRGRRRKMPEQA